MSILEAFKIAVKSIWANKVRALLTMLGVIIGVGAVIAAVAFAQGSTKSITSSIEGLGTNLITISIMGRGSNRTISYEDLQKFTEENRDTISALSPVVRGDVLLKNNSITYNTQLIGTNTQYQFLKNVFVEAGRFILPIDIEHRQRVAVVGTRVVDELFGGNDPLGEEIKIDGHLFKIVGILEQKDAGQEQGDDDRIIIPVTVAQRLMNSAQIRNFEVQATDSEVVDNVMESLESLMYSVYQDSATYRVFNQAQMLSTLGDVTGIMMAVLGGIATISLIVGGIGIMNIMLVSVTERTREIGIRKAIGAKRNNILVQFLIEALMVTGIGGGIGVLFGLGIIKFVIGGLNIVPEVYSLTWIFLSFGISLFVGIIFGVFPAYKAANLKPIEALRAE